MFTAAWLDNPSDLTKTPVSRDPNHSSRPRYRALASLLLSMALLAAATVIGVGRPLSAAASPGAAEGTTARTPPREILQQEFRPLTLLDLATHTSGLPRLPSNLDPANQVNPYADYMVARLEEFLAGQNYERLIVSRICSPLGLKSTRFTRLARPQPERHGSHLA